MRKILGRVAAWTSPVLALALVTGCSKNTKNVDELTGADLAKMEQAQLDDLAELCGFTCNTLAEANASISGVGSIDAFFSAVLTLEGKAAELEAEVNLSLGQMAAVVGAEVGANAEATVANIKAGFEAEIAANIDGGLTLDYEPPACSVTATATVEAAAKCDVDVEPGSATVECKGECKAEASVMAECSGELKCTGTAPSFKCEGECSGACELDVAATCEGTCQGTCSVEAEADCDGEFEASTEGGAGGGGTCKVRSGASCKGMCEGTCELSAGGSCSGQCKGECTYDPGGASCQGQASCSASGEASVECSGECKGEVEPPAVKAECEATAKAEAEFNAECTPPSVALSYNLSASFEADADVDAKAAFSAKVEAFAHAYADLLAKGARLEGMLKATAALPVAGADAVGTVAADLIPSADLKVAFKLSCVADELPLAIGKIEGAVESLQGSASAVTSATGIIGG